MDMATKLAPIFRHRLQHRMEQLGWCQRDLAEKLGTTQSYVSQLVTGHRKSGLETLEQLAEVLGVDASWLISENPAN